MAVQQLITSGWFQGSGMSARDAIKDFRDRYPRLDVSELRRRVEGFDYVSFDLFDTLLKRDVARPADIFALVGRARRNEDPLFDDDLYARARQSAEQQARLSARRQGRREVTHKEILDVLEPPFAKHRDRLEQLEIELELACCTPSTPLVDLFRELIDNGKRVYVTSNTYLPAVSVHELLERIGCTGFSGMYLSHERDAVKQDGSLFDVLLRAEGIRPQDLIHVGDSRKADVRGARLAQIDSVQVPRVVPAMHWRRAYGFNESQRVDHGAVVAFLDHRTDPDWCPDYTFGYQAFGPLLFAFTRWLHIELVSRNIRKVFFFSRDGYILQKAYNRMFGLDGISTSYLYVSRRALRVPQLWCNTELPAVVESFPQVQLLTLRAFLSNLGLNPEKYEDAVQRRGWTLDQTTRRDTILGDPKFESLYAEIRDDVISVSQEEHALLMDYLSQEGFTGEVGVVDIGWYGSLQFFLQEAIRADPSTDVASAGSALSEQVVDTSNPVIHGFYVGLTKDRRQGIDAQGFIVDAGAQGTTDIWRGFSGLVEYLFLAQEGSTRRLKRLPDGRIGAETYNYEYAPNDPEVSIVRNIQAGALRFVEDFHRSRVSSLTANDSRAFFAPLSQAGNHPARASLKLFGDVRFFEESPVYLARPSGWRQYLKSPSALRRDFYFSKWKIGFLKRLFRVPLPYRRVYDLMKKI